MGRALRLLVVEDSEDDFELFLRALRRAGYEPFALRVETAEAMSTALDRESWDLVFSDWSLPRFSAPEALEVLKQKPIDVPFIIVSGTVGEDIAVEALTGGAHDFLVKDRLARLAPAIERALREASDRRDRAKMQEQLLISDRMASVGILAAGVAHEINNPLASVLANLDLAVRDVARLHERMNSDDEIKELGEMLSDAREAAARIRNIVRDLKLFSRSDDERRSAVDVRHVLESSLRMAWNEIRHRARLSKEFAPVPPVLANESRLGQVFLNLIVNATQAIREGQAEAHEIRVATYLDSSGRVVVEIADDGAGMPAEVQKRLFTPFFTTKPVGVGTGLGLSICHRIVASLGGEISVSSALGKGTTFRVHLPAAQGVEVPVEDLPVASHAARRGRILVIDDEAIVASAVRRTLAEEHDIVAANRALDALSRIVTGDRYDVILCDLMMPEMTGMDLYEELQKIAPDQAEKMIFLTGGAFTSRARNFLDEVENQRIDKPFDGAALRALVNDRIK